MDQAQRAFVIPRRRACFFLLSAALAGCARDDLGPTPTELPGATTPGPSPSARIAPALSHDALPHDARLQDAPPSDEAIPMPRPYRDRGAPAVALNATCVSCHADEAAEWRGSRHRQAFTNSAFQAALAIEPTAFCRGCHAPEADPRKLPPRALGDLGVGCVTCHVTDEGSVLAAPRSGGANEDRAPHPIRRSADFGRSGACAGCHEFRFPSAIGDSDPELMQTTLREHERARGAPIACADCHMPAQGGRRGHAFSSTRDPAWLRGQIQIAAARAGDGHVRVTLSQPAPGHAFPTGDLFRRLEVGGEIRDAQGKLLARDVRHLARHFEIIPGRPDRQLIRDDRVFDDPAAVDLALSPPPGATVRWWVTYQRVATVGIGDDPEETKIESDVPLSTGVLAW